MNKRAINQRISHPLVGHRADQPPPEGTPYDRALLAQQFAESFESQRTHTPSTTDETG